MEFSQSAYQNLVHSGRQITAKIGEFVPSLHSEYGLLPTRRCPLDDRTMFLGLSDRMSQAYSSMQPLFHQCVQTFRGKTPTDLPISEWIRLYVASCPPEKVLLHAYAAVVLFSAAQMQAQSGQKLLARSGCCAGKGEQCGCLRRSDCDDVCLASTTASRAGRALVSAQPGGTGGPSQRQVRAHSPRLPACTHGLLTRKLPVRPMPVKHTHYSDLLPFLLFTPARRAFS